jgi:hypothetical protein
MMLLNLASKPINESGLLMRSPQWENIFAGRFFANDLKVIIS